MLANSSLLSLDPAALAPAGTVLFQRGDAAQHIVHLAQGRVVLGVMVDGHMAHALGMVEGPFWLEAASALLSLPHAVDAVAETDVQVQSVSRVDFVAEVATLPPLTQSLLMDMARSQRQQTETAFSRMAKDADARCAEWLWRHAEPVGSGGSWAVQFTERKRTIAAQLGMAPETLSRVLRHLRELELISGGGRMLGLPNLQALRELAGV
jgi:CRP-like cAMP-binding protein